MLSHPVVHVMPRLVKLNNPVYVAFTQFGMGHYDAVVMNTSDSTHKSYSTPKQSPVNTGATSCSCGKSVTLQSHCIPLKNRYTTTIKCSCLKAENGCSQACRCKNCANPHGSREASSNAGAPKRKRQRHKWQQDTQKSALYGIKLGEEMSPGRRTILEFFILEGIFQHCEVEDAETLTILYNAITEFADIFECQLPL